MTSPTPVLTVMQNKGGVGKTTVVCALAETFATRGARVLVADLDQQSNATLVLDPHRISDGDFTVLDVIHDHSPGVAYDAAVPTAWNDLPLIAAAGGAVDLLPGDKQFNPEVINRYPLTALSTALAGENPYDLVILDTPPSTGGVVQSSLVAGDHALIVSQAQHFSVGGIEQAITLVEEFNQAAIANAWPTIEVSGVVFNQVAERQKEHLASIAETTAAFGELVWQPVIPMRAIVQNASAAHYPIAEMPGKEARALVEVLTQLAARVAALYPAANLTQLLSSPVEMSHA